MDYNIKIGRKFHPTGVRDAVLRFCPPQRRSIMVGWYNKDPGHGLPESIHQYRKKLFRLWFPQMAFAVTYEHSNDDVFGDHPFYTNLYLAFLTNNQVMFPTLPNVYGNGRVCLKIPREHSLDNVINDFWKSEFWEYEVTPMWTVSLMLTRRHESPNTEDGKKGAFLQFIQEWESWNLQQTEEKLSQLWGRIENKEQIQSWPDGSEYNQIIKEITRCSADMNPPALREGSSQDWFSPNNASPRKGVITNDKYV